MTRKTHTTREGWLVAAVALLDKKFFKANGYEMPEKVGVSCGFPKFSSKAIGQAWAPSASGDKTSHMFISPTIDEPTRVLDILLHELIHIVVGVKEGHKGLFRKLAKEFELEGKLTATYVTPGTPLHTVLEVMVERLGPYPHTTMTARGKATKKTNKWVRYQSPMDNAYKVLVSPNKVEEFGPPHDPWLNEMEPVS